MTLRLAFFGRLIRQMLSWVKPVDAGAAFSSSQKLSPFGAGDGVGVGKGHVPTDRRQGFEPAGRAHVEGRMSKCFGVTDIGGSRSGS